MCKERALGPRTLAHEGREAQRPRGFGRPLVLLLLLGFACKTGGLTTDGSLKKIDTWPIGHWVQTDKKDPVFYLWQDGNAHRLTLAYDYHRTEVDLGLLERSFGEDAPLEARFLSFEGVQFIVFWVDQQRLPEPAKSILVERPMALSPEQGRTRQSKMAEVTHKGLAVLPIFPVEQGEWHSLTYLAIFPRDIEAPLLFRVEFSPPFSLQGRFREVPSSP